MPVHPPEIRGRALVACLTAYFVNPRFAPSRLPLTFDQFCDLRELDLLTFKGIPQPAGGTFAFHNQPFFRGVRVVLQGEKK